ncbi:malto-oligosyltrehalose synthase [Puniceibacterium antarcticum]|uniref:malto-oligosyltrehalose synthase n=1 Tax=Puniceibacterium antarcticum TaxID=1206336 RepID=UPI000C186E25|nr:malto-oligosyltrehalose synthase [Puniceibacterium antarcticum]
MILPTATYRLQLREGVDFDAAIAYLGHLVEMGISHLYLSPIFTAAPGSTHGYDVTDPSEIDPALGGREGFKRLSDAAQAAKIGLILDIVPNHTAFSLDNPWLVDVLRHGQDSRYAPHFDIDWEAGPLVLPWLEEPFEALADQGKVIRSGETLRLGELAIPLRPGVEMEDPQELHEAQVWRAVHWARERDGVTHRRFFNVTGLIGMRVEEQRVFDDMHALLLELLAEGRVQGIRIDHIDGLADPAGYLVRLRAAVGETPFWVEKILTGDERLPDWPVEGTTGYEAAAIIARVLADREGAERLHAAWVDQTGGAATFHEAMETAKGDVIRRDLAAELYQLIGLARVAFAPRADVDPGDEALREAVFALLRAFPRYRTYVAGGTASPEDRALMGQVAQEAGATLRSGEVVDFIAEMITDPQNADETALSIRFEQVTGALLAKSHEDTAGFRWTPYLAACEVGADPDRPAANAADLDDWAQVQPGTGMILTSSHDTKRSEDARMRLVAWTHSPDDALSLIAHARSLPQAEEVPANVLWYLVQSSLAIWDRDDAELDERLADHLTKALREGDEITNWTHPDAAAERAVQVCLNALINNWRHETPAALSRIVERGEQLSLCQLALKMMLPGSPDIYRGCEATHFALTDPDNRRPVDLEALHAAHAAPGLAGQKARLLKLLLTLRRDHAELFANGAFRAEQGAEGLVVRRSGPLAEVVLCLAPGGSAVKGTHWPQQDEAAQSPLSLSVLPAETAIGAA